MEDILFLKDDLAYERDENIKALLSLLEEKSIPNEVFATKRFIVSAIYAAQTIKEKKAEQEHKAAEKKSLPKIIKKIEQINLSQPIKKEQETLPVVDIPKPPKIIEVVMEDKPLEIKTRQEYPVILSATQTLAKAVIDFENGKLKYNIIEPQINFKILSRTIDHIKRKLNKDVNILRDDILLSKNIKKACKKYKVEYTSSYFENIKYYLYRDFLHFGKIDPLIMDNNISTITCEGINKLISILINNQKIETNLVFSSNEEINDLLFKFAKQANKQLNAANPMLDAVITTQFNTLKIEANLGLEEISSRFMIKKQS